MVTLDAQRQAAMALLRAGRSVAAVAQQLGHSERWVRKWRQRYAREGWAGLAERTRAPQRHGTRWPAELDMAIVLARSTLEAEAAAGTGLKYIGARAVRTRLQAQGLQPLPSLATLERRLRALGLTRPYRPAAPAAMHYPHLQPMRPHEVCQVDIVPHYLLGGQRVGCFNAVDVVSRLPTGQAYAQQRAQDAAEFLVHVWQTLGIARYTQVDNQDCFSGGHTHPYVLGKVVRLALAVGTELVFTPHYHPQSNGAVERFHQEYDRHVWQDTYLADLAAVERHAAAFFARYRQSRHHRALDAQTPQEVHRTPPRRLPQDFRLPPERLPVQAGRVHFMRQVSGTGTISLLNVEWAVPQAVAGQGVWATLELRPTHAHLAVYDAPPDAQARVCLGRHPFPLAEPVLAPPAPPAASLASTGQRLLARLTALALRRRIAS